MPELLCLGAGLPSRQPSGACHFMLPFLQFGNFAGVTLHVWRLPKRLVVALTSLTAIKWQPGRHADLAQSLPGWLDRPIPNQQQGDFAPTSFLSAQEKVGQTEGNEGERTQTKRGDQRVCACVRACVRAYMFVCVCVCVCACADICSRIHIPCRCHGHCWSHDLRRRRHELSFSTPSLPTVLLRSLHVQLSVQQPLLLRWLFFSLWQRLCHDDPLE